MLVSVKEKVLDTPAALLAAASDLLAQDHALPPLP
jgi:hypothetical protein